MNTQIKISPILIYSQGDESVGIFTASWRIEQDVYIEVDEIEEFREELTKVWNLIADDAKVIFATDNCTFIN